MNQQLRSMHIKSIRLHNFRSILDSGVIELNDLSLLVGPNNAGKSNIMCALRVLYDEEKFNPKVDFPSDHLKPKDKESWIDVVFGLSDDEHANLPDYANSYPNELRIRKYFKSENPDCCRKDQSNIFAYLADGAISKELFFGAKNVSEAKIGKIIFIPSVNRTEDIMKTSGPSPWRQIATFVFEKVSKKGATFSSLDQAFTDFNTTFRKDTSIDGHSLQNLIDDVNTNLKEWGITFDIDIKKLRVEDIIKNLLETYLKDEGLGGQRVEASLHGQGFQRHLIYTLIKLSAKYVDQKPPKKKEFSPDLTLILFEEPEAFLHPAQQESLSTSLYDIARSPNNHTQVLVSTHSPLFVSRNADDLSGIIRLRRQNGETMMCQISTAAEQGLFNENGELLQFLDTKAKDPTVPQVDRDDIARQLNGLDQGLMLDLETMRYFLWLNSDRCATFFADFVILCEGLTEKALFDYFLRTEPTWEPLRKKRIFFLDTAGKYNMHRFMNLLDILCIRHAVLIDSDGHSKHHKYVNDYIELKKNPHTARVIAFAPNFEEALGIPPCPLPHGRAKNVKPEWAFLQLEKGVITPQKIAELKLTVEAAIA